MDALERDLLDAAFRQGREDLRVLAPLAAERPLPVDVGLDAVAVADVHAGGALQALDRPVQRIDAPALHVVQVHVEGDRKSTRLNSSHLVISYAVFCLKKKKKKH